MDSTTLRQIFERLDQALEESVERLPERFKADPVVQDNLRYIKEDYL